MMQGFIFLFGSVHGLGFGKKRREVYKATPYISVANLTQAVDAWTGQDVAVFFYSPYGDAGSFSRQVLPLWDEVYKWHHKKRTKNLAIVKFNCEATLSHQQSCYDFGVRQYPTIRYYGYDRLSFQRGSLRRAADYRGLAMAEALRDWTVALRAISKWQYYMDRIRIFFGLKAAPELIELRDLRQLKRNYEMQAQLDADLKRYRSSAATGDDAATLWDDLFAPLSSSSSTTGAPTANAASSSSSSSTAAHQGRTPPISAPQ